MILSTTAELGYTPKRIISLVPSQTELLYGLGLEEETIAITKFCVHPETWFKNKPRIGGTKAIDIEKIKDLKPDLIIANKEENVKEQIEELAASFPVWVTDVNTLDEAYGMIGDIGKLCIKETVASSLITSIKVRFDVLFQKRDIKNSIPAAYLIWKNPFMTIGGDTFISSIMEAAGLRNIFSDRARYPEITLPQLRSMNCKLLLLSSEPYPFKDNHIAAIQEELPGIRILLVDGEMFSWYGSRLLLAPAYFKSLIQEI